MLISAFGDVYGHYLGAIGHQTRWFNIYYPVCQCPVVAATVFLDGWYHQVMLCKMIFHPSWSVYPNNLM
jgi:hypothetical protein